MAWGLEASIDVNVVDCLEVSPDTTYLVMPDNYGFVYLLDSMTGDQLMKSYLQNCYVSVVRFSPDTSILGVGGNMGVTPEDSYWFLYNITDFSVLSGF